MVIIIYFQIGLPREHASALCKVYLDNISQITKVLKNESLQIGRLNYANLSKGNDGEYLMTLQFSSTPNKSEEQIFTLTREQIQLLISGMFYFLNTY
jgi:hypothetical protein